MWTHPAIECLLVELKKRKMLYDQQHVDYLNRAKRRTCLEQICKILLEKEELDATVDDVKAKIQVLRSQLNKELRYMARSKKYKPKLWCFKKMEFLKPYCGLKNTQYTTQYTSSLPSAGNGLTNGHQHHLQHQEKQKEYKNSTDQFENISNSTIDVDFQTSSNILMSKTNADTDENGANYGGNYPDLTQQFYDTIALTHQIVQKRIEDKLRNKPKAKKHSSWEGELVQSQLDLISDETIRSDTMWEIQCVLRRGIEQDRVLPKGRRNRRSSIAASEISADGSCISLDSNDSQAKDATAPAEDDANILIE